MRRGGSQEKPLDIRPLLAYCRADLPALLRCLRQAVEIESPSHSKPGVDRMAHFFAHEFQRDGGRVRLLPYRTAGSAVVAEFWHGAQRSLDPRSSEKQSKPVLVLGHLDTVWDIGTLRRMPFRILRGRAYGPGILDMKSGIVCGLWAVRALRAARMTPSAPIRFFLNSDEETGSHAFRREIEREARSARAVLVLEPAAARGALKTSRKGVGEFQIMVRGRSSHAGISPESGVNAIVELTRQILRFEKLSRPRSGLTLNAGVIEGGTRPNVVPEFARAQVDVRIPRLRDAKVIERKVFGLKPVHPEARLEITGGINRPPMERMMAAGLWRLAAGLGRELGMELEEASTGGGSDGNFTAALGIPTLDGLGGVGDGAHARDEHVIIKELPRRAALLAALLATI
jgi:glutamate carboxypeptidase